MRRIALCRITRHKLATARKPFVTLGAPLLLAGLILLPIAASTALAQTESVLYNFTGGVDGGSPSSLIADGHDNFIGTAFYGGPPSGGLGYGTVFELSPNGSGGWNENVIYSFPLGGADGSNPNGSILFDSVGNLYGTTFHGGAGCYPDGCGVVFELSPAGGSWKETVLYDFAGGTDGAYPVGALIMDSAGNLFGTTRSGGSAGGGTVFELSPSEGVWKEQVIYNSGTNAYGIGIAEGLSADAAGNLYGANYDSVFDLSPNGNGGWNFSVLHTFTGHVGHDNVFGAVGTPVFDRAGNIYGTTLVGGPWGVVYKMTPGKKGKWKEKAIHAFSGIYGAHDGASPAGALVIDAAGNVYGTTSRGGTNHSEGTVFELVAPVGTGRYEHKVLWNFGASGDGSSPSNDLIRDSAGNLYGTASSGGSSPSEAGVVFEVTP